MEPAASSQNPTPETSPVVPPEQSSPAPQVSQPVSEPPRKRNTGMWVAVAIVILVLLAGGAYLLLHKNSNTDSKKTTATNNIQGSTTDTSKLSIQGITLTDTATTGLTKQDGTVTAADLQTQYEKQGLTNYFNLTGTTYYNSADKHNIVIAAWGEPGSSYSHAGFMHALTTTSGASATATDLPAQTVHASNGKQYSLTCSLVTITISSISTYSAYCDSPTVGGKGYIDFTATTDTNAAAAESTIAQFIKGTTVNLK